MHYKLEYSGHAIERIRRRGFTFETVDYIVSYGQLIHRAGAVHYFLRNKDIPQNDRKDDKLRRLAGSVVLLSKDYKTVITVYRSKNKHALKEVNYKAKYDNRTRSY